MAFLLAAVSIQAEGQTITSRFDLNRDGDVTVTDVRNLVDLILGYATDDEPVLTLSATDVTVAMGQTATVDISGGNEKYLSASGDADVAFPTVKGHTLTVHPVKIGYTVFTVRDNQGVRDYTIGVTVTGTAPESVELVDLGLPSGLRWANQNLGAEAPEEYGAYYAWGEISEKDNYDWVSYSHCNGNMNTIHDIGENISGTQYDAARMNWGGSWRMPTQEEYKELIDNCTWTWTDVNGTMGKMGTGPNGNTIFFPAAGYKAGTGTYSTELYGNYWTATHIFYTPTSGYSLGGAYAYYMVESKRSISTDTYYQNEGYSVRAVMEGAE